MAYSDKVNDHYNNPRNVGTLPKDDPNVGTGLVGAPECGDVMKLQIKVRRDTRVTCTSCGWSTFLVLLVAAEGAEDCLGLMTCPTCKTEKYLKTEEVSVIEDAKFKTFGCGSAIASSSLATEWLKGKTLEEAGCIKNTDIVHELKLPPVKIHCSVLAEDAIKAALENYREKQTRKKETTDGN